MSKKEKNYASDDFKEKVIIVFVTALFLILNNIGFYWFFYCTLNLSFKDSVFFTGYLDFSLLTVFLLERIKKISKIMFIIKYLFYFILIFLFIFLFKKSFESMLIL
ncbi:hypothetical protein [Fusobacterium varium]